MRAQGFPVRCNRADAALRWFMRYRKPTGWQQWPEVVWRDDRAPHLLGHFPHTWVGSDFVRSVVQPYPATRY